jgi:hypothetical protein
MIQRIEARRLSSRREWSLISSSLSPALQEQSAARLKSKISRARELRDKYRIYTGGRSLYQKPG